MPLTCTTAPQPGRCALLEGWLARAVRGGRRGLRGRRSTFEQTGDTGSGVQLPATGGGGHAGRPGVHGVPLLQSGGTVLRERGAGDRGNPDHQGDFDFGSDGTESTCDQGAVSCHGGPWPRCAEQPVQPEDAALRSEAEAAHREADPREAARHRQDEWEQVAGSEGRGDQEDARLLAGFRSQVHRPRAARQAADRLLREDGDPGPCLRRRAEPRSAARGGDSSGGRSAPNRLGDPASGCEEAHGGREM
mmetsp:Transcript_19694/g.74533  ORF Transcript_19694/g.74533 Transcript_19694/m.74533 type:complete len:248 (-) Transcript_19694:197-940(-)